MESHGWAQILTPIPLTRSVALHVISLCLSLLIFKMEIYQALIQRVIARTNWWVRNFICVRSYTLYMRPCAAQSKHVFAIITVLYYITVVSYYIGILYYYIMILCIVLYYITIISLTTHTQPLARVFNSSHFELSISKIYSSTQTITTSAVTMLA